MKTDARKTIADAAAFDLAEACAKPKKVGDLVYCPYHTEELRETLGLEKHMEVAEVEEWPDGMTTLRLRGHEIGVFNAIDFAHVKSA